MSDDRNIRGTVSVSTTTSDSVPRVALDMARMLWNNQHDKSPSMKDDEFFILVQDCARALTPNYTFRRVSED